MVDRFEVAVLAAAAGVSCCHTDDYKAPLLCRRGQLQATIQHHDNHNHEKCHNNNHSDWSVVNFFVAIQSHISTNLLTILGTRLSPMLTKAQAKQTWTDTRSNKSPSIMTLKIKNADQNGPGFADMDNTCSNDNQQDYKRLVKTYVITPKSQYKKSAFISLPIPSCPHCQIPTVSQVLLCRNGAFAIIMTKHRLKF